LLIIPDFATASLNGDFGRFLEGEKILQWEGVSQSEDKGERKCWREFTPLIWICNPDPIVLDL